MKREELIAAVEPCQSCVDFYQFKDEILRHLKEVEADEEAPVEQPKARKGSK